MIISDIGTRGSFMVRAIKSCEKMYGEITYNVYDYGNKDYYQNSDWKEGDNLFWKHFRKENFIEVVNG